MMSEFDQRKFTEKVARIKENTGDTNLDLARKAGISLSTLGNYLAGRTAPRAAMRRRLAEAWSVPPEWLEQAFDGSATDAGPCPAGDVGMRKIAPSRDVTGKPRNEHERAALDQLSRNLFAACRYRGINPSWLAHKAGVSRAKVDNILMSYMPASPELVDVLARELRVPTRWLWSGTAAVEEVDWTQQPSPDRREPPAVTFNIIPPGAAGDESLLEAATTQIVPVPILEGAVAAGAPSKVFEREVTDWAFCYKPHLPHPQRTTCVRVTGDSMGDVAPDGALVGIDHAVQDLDEILRRKSPLVAVRDPDGNGVLIRRVKRVNRHAIFYPEVDLPQHSTFVWTLDDDTVANPIIGLVVFIYRACE